MIDFKALLSSVRASDHANEYTAYIDETWLQGRTAFGGLSTALIVKAMLNNVPTDRRLRSLSVLFVGPVPAGDHRIILRKLRVGGSVTHIQGDILCNGEVATTVSAAFGKDRPSSITLTGPTIPSVAPPDTLESMPYIDGLTPPFTQYFDMRMCTGAMPYSQADSPDFSGWMRFKEAGELDLAALVALGDLPPMPGLNMIKYPGNGSSLSWYLEFPSKLPKVDMSDWWFYDYRSQAAGNGYFNNYATVWDANGNAIMFSRQVATIFER